METIPSGLPTIWYMGHKARVLDRIASACEGLVGAGATVCDLFSGSGTVAHALAADHRVAAADAQAYAEVLARCLIEPKPFHPVELDPERDLGARRRQVETALEAAFEEALREEARFLGGPMDADRFEEYRRYCEATPHVNGVLPPADLIPASFRPARSLYGPPWGEGPPRLFSTYFANAYFGLAQCVELDALRAAIAQVGEPARRAVYLACLLAAASASTSGTNHFAEFRRMETPAAARQVVGRRRSSIRGRFAVELARLAQTWSAPRHENAAYRAEWRDLLGDREGRFPLVQEAELFYLDPPYSPANYSRYYHVLETCVLYDYPQCLHRGRYRQDRLQSAFCSPRRATGEMEALLGQLAPRGARALISYAESPTALIGREDLVAACERHYRTVRVEELPLAHSKQGRPSALRVKELLLSCEGSR
ncbi:MAG: DNA adenine methylase [Planctomycetes bacterium]|nr:DNA adenine methylase [Planctomycetota bacterium]